MNIAAQFKPWAALLALVLLSCTSQPVVDQRGALRVEGVVEPTAQRQAALRAYQDVRSAGFRGWLNDAALIATRLGEVAQLHRVSEPLGMREQLTFSSEAVSSAWPSPDPAAAGFVYARDVGGSENYQLHWFDLVTRESTLLTDGHSRYIGVVWSKSGKQFAYSTNQRNGRSWDIHVRTPDGEPRVALETEDLGWYVEDFAPDGARLLVRRYLSVNESRLYELHLTGGGLRPVLDPELRIAIGEARYGADGATVLFTADLGGEFLRLHRLTLADGHVEVLTEMLHWDIDSFALSPDGARLALAVNEGGLSRLTLIALPAGRMIALPRLPAGVVGGLAFDSSSDRLGFTLNAATRPADVYSIDVKARRLERWTRSETGGLRTEQFAVPVTAEYPTFDRLADGSARVIPAFVYLPSTPGPHPVVIDIHGGPASQYRPRFRAFTQFLVGELGIAVVAPNVRGSRGYGKSYLKLDNGRLREDSVRDIGALLDWIETQPELDQSRVAVYGGSYGGYMSLASLVHYSDRLSAGVDLFGISNFNSFLSNTKSYRRDLRRAEYGDDRDPAMRAFLEEISPLTRVDRIERPLLVYQGVNDPRVPAAESDQMVAALQARDVPVWYIAADNEGHGMRHRSNRDFVYAAAAEFLARYLLGEGA